RVSRRPPTRSCGRLDAMHTINSGTLRRDAGALALSGNELPAPARLRDTGTPHSAGASVAGSVEHTSARSVGATPARIQPRARRPPHGSEPSVMTRSRKHDPRRVYRLPVGVHEEERQFEG